MRHSSARQRLAAGTIVLALLVAGALYAASGTGQSYSLSPEQVVGADAPIGETVKVSGVVGSFTSEGCELTSDDGAARVRVLFAEPQVLRVVGPGAVALVEGQLTRSGFIDDATLIAPSSPSKYSSGQGDAK